MNDFVKSILRGTIGRETLEIKKDAAQLVKDGIGAATGGVIGNPRMGQPQGGVDRNGIAARPEVGVTGPQAGMNQPTQRFMQQFGGQPGGAQGQQGQGGLMGFLGGLGGRIAGSIVPSEQMINRLKGGAAALGATAVGIAATGSALVQDGSDAARKAFQKPTMDEIARDVASGKLDGHKAQEMINEGLVELPKGSTVARQAPAPVEDRSFRAAAATATAPAATPAAEPASQVQTFPVSMPSTSTIQAIPPTITSASTGQPVPTQFSPTPAPAITTNVDPAAAFAAAAAPAGPAAPAAAAGFQSRFDDGVNARAQAFLKQSGPGTGPA